MKRRIFCTLLVLLVALPISACGAPAASDDGTPRRTEPVVYRLPLQGGKVTINGVTIETQLSDESRVRDGAASRPGPYLWYTMIGEVSETPLMEQVPLAQLPFETKGHEGIGYPYDPTFTFAHDGEEVTITVTYMAPERDGSYVRRIPVRHYMGGHEWLGEASLQPTLIEQSETSDGTLQYLVEVLENGRFVKFRDRLSVDDLPRNETLTEFPDQPTLVITRSGDELVFRLSGWKRQPQQ